LFLLEHHGKELLASHGIAVPVGVFVPPDGDLDACGPPAGPLMVKAQVATGGRGKAGAVQGVRSLAEAREIIARLSGSTVRGRPIHGFRVEQRVEFVHEAYVSLSIDATEACMRLMVSTDGGIDVEAIASQGQALHSVLANSWNLADAAVELCSSLPPTFRAALSDAARRLAEIFVEHEAILLEVNPLFILADGSWIIGDIKLVIDDNAIGRQPAIAALLKQNPDIYLEAARKLTHGFDYVEVDADGEIGLITTGAGLSMQLIDELKAQGRRPVNFCDIRSGQFRGDPARLIAVMRWIASRPRVRVVLVNIFAGITDLAEFAHLLVQAAAAVPELRVPVVARLIGRNLAEAREILQASDLAVTLEPDLDRAITLTLATLDGTGMRHG
jgi:succinyl-CoA synthetase beta subunit